jgi:hypothetical protein
MKKLIVLLMFLQVSVCFAQRPNGGRRGNGNSSQPSQQRETPKFEASKIAGILEYQPKKILKKLKLKKKDSTAIAVMEYIDAYNAEIKKIETANKDLFEGLNIVVNQNMEAAIKNRNRELMQETRKMIEENLAPIRVEINTHQNNLNTSLESILTEEQHTKWLSYQKSERANLIPKRRSGNDARNRPDDASRKSGRRRG